MADPLSRPGQGRCSPHQPGFCHFSMQPQGAEKNSALAKRMPRRSEHLGWPFSETLRDEEEWSEKASAEIRISVCFKVNNSKFPAGYSGFSNWKPGFDHRDPRWQSSLWG
ncbi:hypothetical protein [Pseudooceanicola algae]|uniref:hypothetical protein n=1 Tax=Pseudooceanicola algae TaxID=1537215 RepID=UPI0011C4959E|nr:hypothetical protein [Pseudooceanicola algae]